MNRVFMGMVLASTLVAPTLRASLGDGDITLTAGYGNASGGGVFNAVTHDNTATPQPALGNFGTFCIEYSEHLSYSTKYSYVINSGAVLGGASTKPDGTATFDPISKGTSYLYSEFRKGVILADHNPTDANLLQRAIWYLEGETTILPGSDVANSNTGAVNPLSMSSSEVTGSQANKYITMAKAHFNGSLAAAAAAAASGENGVVVLNLYDYNYAGDTAHIRQDQLGLVPEPTTILAGALMVLPFGASVFRILRNNKIA